jgi:glycerate 2-kinase
MRAVVAPDKFKGSATAARAAAALAAGMRAGRPGIEVAELPVADGGDGTVAAAIAAGFGAQQVAAEGPDGAPVLARFAIRGSVAVVELAEASGLRLLTGPLAPLTASTYGLGQVIAAALGRGAQTIVLGLGGSASTDGGAGMVQALGARLADGMGRPLARGGAALRELASIDISALERRLAGVRFLVASDVDSPLLGPAGAAAVFAPQKGAGQAQVALLDEALTRWAELTAAVTGLDVAAAAGAGAAGGTGFAALAYLRASLVPGIDLVLDLIGFDAALAGAALVVTGEGCLDAQTLSGKAPAGVARAAARRSVPVVAVAGQVLLDAAALAAAGFAQVYSLEQFEPDLAVRIARVLPLLERAGKQIAASPLLAAI